MIERRLNRSATTPDSEPKTKLGTKRATIKESDVAARTCQMENDCVECDGVKPVAHLTHNLAQPELAKTAIAAKQCDVANRLNCL